MVVPEPGGREKKESRNREASGEPSANENV
jgi:hypothetical protein